MYGLEMYCSTNTVLLCRIYFMDTAYGDPVVTLNNGIELIYKQNVDIIFGPTNASGTHYFEK